MHGGRRQEMGEWWDSILTIKTWKNYTSNWVASPVSLVHAPCRDDEDGGNGGKRKRYKGRGGRSGETVGRNSAARGHPAGREGQTDEESTGEKLGSGVGGLSAS